MQRKTLLLLALLMLLMNQYTPAQTPIRFCNQSSSKIDSIVLFGTDNRRVMSISADSCKNFEIPFQWLNTHSAILCNYRIYFTDKYFTGQLLKGLSNYNVVIDRDNAAVRNFTITITNTSQRTIDSVVPVNGSIDTTYEITPRTQAIELNYGQFSVNPNLKVSVNGAMHSVSFANHNFKNLSANSASIWVNDSSVLQVNVPFEKMVEFEVVLEAGTLGTDLASLKVKSSSLTAIKTYRDSTGKVLIFNLKQLKKHPVVIIKLNRKRFKIALSAKDFSEEFYGRKYFYITNKSIRPQYL